MHLIIDQGYGVAQAAKAMKVGLSTLQRWLRQYRQETKGVTPEARTITPEQLRITILFHGTLAGHLLVKLYDKARHAKRMLI